MNHDAHFPQLTTFGGCDGSRIRPMFLMHDFCFFRPYSQSSPLGEHSNGATSTLLGPRATMAVLP